MRYLSTFVLSVGLLLSAQVAQAHFGVLIPSASTVTLPARSVELTVAFAHPFEMNGMDMAKPQEFGVVAGGKKTDLLASLTPTKFLGKSAWKAAYAFARPGVASFYVVPQPYYEPAEGTFIQHITKTCVAAFGEEDGWDEPLGLRTEIVPLTRPFAGYAGSVFQGRVLVEGKPVPGAKVEVELYNRDKKYHAPNEYFVTQVVKADDNGVFTFACPRAGWWGFAALTEAKETLARDGEQKPVELGAVLWIELQDFKTGK